MKKLHEIQKGLLQILKRTVTDPLTIRELQKELDISSPSVVHHHIQQLEKKGYLRRNPVNPKDYQILADSPDKKITYLNLYGLAACGPNGSMLDGDPIDRIPISSRILGFSSSEAFMIKAKGNSMTPKINDGDLVIAQKANDVDSGMIAVCVNEGEALIKKIQKGQKRKEIILVSINPSYDPFVAAKDFRIDGLVRGVYSYHL